MRDPFKTWTEELLSHVWELQDDYWGWSLIDLAKEAGLSTTTVYRYFNKEYQEPRLRTIYKLAKAVGMTLKVIEEVKKGKKVA